MPKSTQPVAVVVMPTYNEAGSIGKMIDTLCGDLFPKIENWKCLLLVVDDTSPDGTYKIVEAAAKKYKNLHLLLNKQKIGIGGAYVKGFRYAMKMLAADVVIEFDGDFQHPPKSIPELLKKIDQGYDYVMGSRKIKGGSNPKGWGFKRLFFSEFGGFVARTIMFFPFKSFFQITDPTTGLKASRVKGFVDTMDMDHLYSKSFAYKIEFLYKMVQLKAKIAEIPLQFQVRTSDSSKIETKTAKDILLTSLKLRWNDPLTQKILKFGTVGFIGYVVNAVTLEVFRRTGLSVMLAQKYGYLNALLANPSSWAGALAAEAAIISNFLWNNFWTFADDKFVNPIKMVLKFLQFNLTSLGAVLIQFLVIGLATMLLGDTTIVRQIFLVIAIGFFVMPYNWLMYNLVIWRKK